MVCDDLIRLGWIREVDSRAIGDHRQGRPARRYEFQSRAGLVLRHRRHRPGDGPPGRPPRRLRRRYQPLANVSVPAGERLAAMRRATDSVLASAAVDPALVLAVAVGVPTPVIAGIPYRRRTCLACPAATCGPRSVAATAGRCRSRTTPTWPPGVSAGARVAAGVDDLVVMVADERLGSGLFLGGGRSAAMPAAPASCASSS